MGKITPHEFWQAQFLLLNEARQQERLNRVREKWVMGQEKYYEEHRTKEHRSATKYRRWGFGLAAVGLLLFTIFALWPYVVSGASAAIGPKPVPAPRADMIDSEPGSLSHSEPRDLIRWLTTWTHPSRPPNILLVVGSMLIIIGGILLTLCERLAHEQLARQYDQMYVVFRGGARELADTFAKKPFDTERAQRTIDELGREALQESAQWLLLRRSKPMELPLG